MSKKGVLLVNLGTPDSPSTPDVRKYLNEFLMDGRVIDINVISRALLVRGIIVPFRAPKSAQLYREIWSDQDGSPLLYYSIKQQQLLQEKLGDEYMVELAMRYQSPSIESALQRLKDALVTEIRVIPLFPQYASASTGSVMEKVMTLVGQWQTIPHISFVNSFHNDDLMIDTFVANAAKHGHENYDHVLFSFHGLPQRQLIKCDHTGAYCLKKDDCCSTLNDTNKFCYSAQSHDTAKLIAAKMGLSKDQYTVCFQSRLGSDPWVQPYTSVVIEELAKQGKKRLLVFCPAFVADCLETVYEVSVEYNDEFKEKGGEHVQLVESLNDHPLFIESLERMVKER
ncbi:ferrochelatase [Mucilaginibacter myungsuensis]|uniref:Ferrochelatase n=1 Tax=Mucilaginibacter myungsuensis TaxID=649104 RepID=A0A929PVJ6_9SPHI|nr:ferrochelatase [Mucilaginibacter myungsuensis]MBE9661204.1 ferrochelatase [Mucilaginibacter myungsuensis]MDN3597349.1 ferrochelatase [Mucilaginibacter myungsuensis]